MEVLTIAATVAGILGFLYVILVGQKSIPEWLRERQAPQKNLPGPSDLPPVSTRVVLHNLPHRGDFIGREKEKRQVHEALSSRSFIITIDGIGGIGKTSLALEVLYECLTASQNSPSAQHEVQKFEAFIWTSARDRELTINDVLDTIARTLEYPFITQLTPEEKRHEISKRLQEKSCLLIVDNFETITDDAVHDFVLNLPEPSKCLITSRVQSLRQARAVSLRGLAKEEALNLIKNEGVRLGIDLGALVADDRNFHRLYEATGGAPLAIRWAIGQIKQRGQSVDGVLNSLHEARGDIFEYIFKRAWTLLSEPAQRILRIMPIFAASASKAAIEAASDIHKWELDEGLGQLVELWLLEASERLDESKRRFSLHPLTRFFAYSNLLQYSELEHQARVRLAEFYESFAKAAGGDKWVWERYDEIEEEKDNIFSLIEWCFENREGYVGMKLTKSVTFFMSIRGYSRESLIFERKAIDVVRERGSNNDLAWLLVHGIGWREINGGDLEKGETLIREGLKIYEMLNNLEGVKAGLLNLGLALRYKGDFEGASQNYKRGMALANELDVLDFKRGLSVLAIAEGKFLEAKEGLESIIPILREKDELTLPGTLGNLAEVCYKIGDYNAAFNLGIEGLELAKKLKRKHTVGWISINLAYVETARRKYQSALFFARQALEVFEKSEMFPKEIEQLKMLIKETQEKLVI